MGDACQARLLGDYRHARMQADAMMSADVAQRLQVGRCNQLAVAQLDGVQRTARQPVQESLQFFDESLRPLAEYPADRGKLEHQRSDMIAQSIQARTDELLQGKSSVKKPGVGSGTSTRFAAHGRSSA